MNIQELKKNSSEKLISKAEELGVENASTLRKQEILFAILKLYIVYIQRKMYIQCFITFLYNYHLHAQPANHRYKISAQNAIQIL